MRESAPVPSPPVRRAASGRLYWAIAAGAVVVAAGVSAVAWLALSGTSPLQEARAAVVRGDLESARRHYAAHLERFPEDDDVRWEYAQRLVRSAPDEALAELERISADSEHRIGALRQIAGLSLRLGREDSAEETLRVLRELQPDDPAVELALAELFFHRGEFERSLGHTRRTLELQPDRPETYLLLAETMDELGRAGEMIEPLRRALELDPDLYAAHSNLAYACLYAGDLECAEREAAWCLRRDPGDGAIHRLLARIARDGGDPERALEHVGRSLSIDPQDLEARLLEADILLFLGRAEEAYAKLEPLEPPARDRRRFLAALARAASQTGRAEQAARFQRELRELAAEDRLPGPLK